MMPILNWNGIRDQKPVEPCPVRGLSSPSLYFDLGMGDDQTGYHIVRSGRIVGSYSCMDTLTCDVVEGRLSLPRSRQRRIFSRGRRS